MDAHERAVESISAVLLLTAAAVVAIELPSHREIDPFTIACFAGAYMLLSRTRFEYGNHYVTPEQLAFVPMLLLAPLPYLPLLCIAFSLLAMLPDVVSGAWHRHRSLAAITDLWCWLPPVLVVAAFAPGAPSADHLPVYAAALAAQVGTDLAWTTVRVRLLEGPTPISEVITDWVATSRVDAILTPVGFAVGLVAASESLFVVIAVAPLAWLFAGFSRERRERHAATIELNRAYRGTVMLLSDVVESDDAYTADHSRSVVELVNATAERLGVSQMDRQELEFAAMLHDVGKIAIPKEVLNKPSVLTRDEFDLIKTHTIEGQQLLDRVGGLLARVGEIVRSCHERWDGAGYPDGLAGEEILLASRIVFTCDAYNAMTTDRPYRAAITRSEALEELRANAGSQFDPAVAAAVIEVVEQGQPKPLATEEVRAVISAHGVPRATSAAG